MAAVGQIPGHALVVAPVPTEHRLTGTSEKIRQFFNSCQGVGTIFSILAGAIGAALWGVQFGLLVAVTGGVLILAIASCQPPVNKMSKYQAETLHFLTLGLPFYNSTHLRMALAADFPQMDLCQVWLESIQPIQYHRDPRLLRPLDGYNINLLTPNRPISYYVDREGGNVAHPNDVLVVP